MGDSTLQGITPEIRPDVFALIYPANHRTRFCLQTCNPDKYISTYTIDGLGSREATPAPSADIGDDYMELLFSKATGGEWQAGQDPSCDIGLRHQGISRHHFKIIAKEEGFYIEDTSRYGTKVCYDGIESRQMRRGEVCLIAPSPEVPLGWTLLSIECAGLVMYIQLPNHGSGCQAYRENVRHATQARQSALPAFNTLALGSGTTTCQPGTPSNRYTLHLEGDHSAASPAWLRDRCRPAQPSWPETPAVSELLFPLPEPSLEITGAVEQIWANNTPERTTNNYGSAFDQQAQISRSGQAPCPGPESLHSPTNHDQVPRFECTAIGCDKDFTQGDALHEHIKLEHVDAARCKCKVHGCPFTSTRSSGLRAHYLAHMDRGGDDDGDGSDGGDDDEWNNREPALRRVTLPQLEAYLGPDERASIRWLRKQMPDYSPPISIIAKQGDNTLVRDDSLGEFQMIIDGHTIPMRVSDFSLSAMALLAFAGTDRKEQEKLRKLFGNHTSSEVVGTGVWAERWLPLGDSIFLCEYLGLDQRLRLLLEHGKKNTSIRSDGQNYLLENQFLSVEFGDYIVSARAADLWLNVGEIFDACGLDRSRYLKNVRGTWEHKQMRGGYSKQGVYISPSSALQLCDSFGLVAFKRTLRSFLADKKQRAHAGRATGTV